MNREILFRGKRLDNGEWVYGYYLFSGSDFILPEGMFLNNIVSVDPSTVGQYTGLTDKNGVKIFEVDILNEDGYYFTVVYDARNAKFKLRYSHVVQYPEWNRGVLMEVIGNIHDNPELLEGHTMKIIPASYEILTPLDGAEILRTIERAGRVCYKSEDKITSGSAERFVRSIIEHGHESVLEHVSLSVRFVVDRGVSHELVRHRVASFSQESTRYCNYSKDGFGGEITVIKPCFLEEGSCAWTQWKFACDYAGGRYFEMLECGCMPQEARTVLPNSLKTEVVMTANLREWRHILRLRTDKAAHPQMREVMVPLLKELKERVPVIFDDIGVESDE